MAGNEQFQKLKVRVEDDRAQTPELNDSVEKMSELSKDVPVEAAKDIQIKGVATAKFGESHEATKATTKEIEVDLSSFNTNASFSGTRFGGLAEPHPEGVTSSWSHFAEEPAPAIGKVDEIKNASTPSYQEATVLNKPVDKVKDGDISSLKSKKVVYGAAAEGMKDKWRKNFDANIKNRPFKVEGEVEDATKTTTEVDPKGFEVNGKATGRLDEKSGPWPTATERNVASAEAIQQVKDKAEKEPGGKVRSEAYEKARTEWKEARDRAHKLEAEYNQKYQEHVGKQSMLWRGVRKTFGFQPALSEELKALQGASIIARREYHAAAKNLADTRDTKPMLKYSAITKTPSEFGGREAVNARYQRMLAHHLVVGVHKQRLETQRNAIDKVWSDNRALSALSRHKKKLLFGAALGATVLTGGTAAAAIAAGGAVGFGTYKVLDKTWVESARRKLSGANAKVGNNFFEKSFLETDSEIEYLNTDVETRKALSKTASTIAGVSAGMTAAGMVSGIDNTPVPPSDVPPVETPSDPGSPDVTPPAESEPVNPEPAEPAVPAEPEAGPEVVDARVHVVERGDNVWNIMEGRGPDANPVGGQSEVLQGMSMAERQEALDMLVDYAEQDPDFAREVGALQSDGNIHKIYPGEEINVSMLDDKLRELLGIEAPADAEPPTPEAADGTPPEEIEAHEPEEVMPEQGPVTIVTNSGNELIIQNPVSNIDQLTVRDYAPLAIGVEEGNPVALRLLEQMGETPESFAGYQEAINRLMDANPGPVDPEITLGEFMEGRNVPPSAVSEPEIRGRTPEGAPYGDYNPFDNNGAEAQEANLSTPEAPQQSMASYVRSVEQPPNGFLDGLFGLGKANVAGTFEQMQNLSVGEIREMVQDNSLPEGVSEAGFDRWVDEMNKVAASDNERFADVIARGANSRVA